MEKVHYNIFQTTLGFMGISWKNLELIYIALPLPKEAWIENFLISKIDKRGFSSYKKAITAF